MQYTVEYFIEKFEAIPEEQWCTEVFANETGCCALGHCGMWNPHPNDEASKLIKLIRPVFIQEGGESLPYNETTIVASINDGTRGFVKLGSTPKQRILAALQMAKEKQS